MNSSSVRKVVSNGVVGGKTARACDNCVKKRARWYCAADDAFLCQGCDHSVHSANSLARRHERVRLKTSSSSSLNIKPSSTSEEALAPPPWHRGFTRKARTPRSGKKHLTRPKLRKDQARHNHHHHRPHRLDPLVPEICGDETSHEENEEQLLYRVPIFDPSVAELCTANSSELALEASVNNVGDSNGVIESKVVSPSGNTNSQKQQQQFLPTETDLAEFAADVESLLGRGLENECFGIEELGFVDCEEKEMGRVKVKEEDEEEDEATEGKDLKSCCWAETSTEIDMMRPEPLELNFEEYEDSPASCGEEDNRKVAVPEEAETTAVQEAKKDEDKEKKIKKKKKKMLLKLNYEAVITAWASQGSPWTTGDRPDFDPDAGWPDCMGTNGTSSQLHHQYQYMDMSGVGVNQAILADGGREARVSRYREKRRTRLFSKKIRYEVRKLNAEKRPRMKGRFVKRVNNSIAGPSFPKLTSK